MIENSSRTLVFKFSGIEKSISFPRVGKPPSRIDFSNGPDFFFFDSKEDPNSPRGQISNFSACEDFSLHFYCHFDMQRAGARKFTILMYNVYPMLRKIQIGPNQ